MSRWTRPKLCTRMRCLSSKAKCPHLWRPTSRKRWSMSSSTCRREVWTSMLKLNKSPRRQEMSRSRRRSILRGHSEECFRSSHRERRPLQIIAGIPYNLTWLGDALLEGTRTPQGWRMSGLEFQVLLMLLRANRRPASWCLRT